ncbi:MAG TPA: hypothetical protein VLU25_19745 [Acidobacteriota bacterium]|nr:hypothetical protein [Acidobacteriota bacterium]
MRLNRNLGPFVSMLGTAAIGILLVYWLYQSLLPWTGQQDKTVLGSKDLVELALNSVQYVQSLTLATFGGAALLLSQKFLGRWRLRSDRLRRSLAAIGMILLVLSLGCGFVTIESVIEAAEQGVVLSKTDSLRHLRFLQSGFLVVGVMLVGGTILADMIRGSGEVSTD